MTAKVRPSGEAAQDAGGPAAPSTRNGGNSLPVPTSQRWTAAPVAASSTRPSAVNTGVRIDIDGTGGWEARLRPPGYTQSVAEARSCLPASTSQSCSVPSCRNVTTRRPSGENGVKWTSPSGRRRTAPRRAPVAAPQRHRDQAPHSGVGRVKPDIRLTVATSRPSPTKAAVSAPPRWPGKACSSRRVATSHRWTPASAMPLVSATALPSGERASASSRAGGAVRRARGLPVATSHTRTAPSRPAQASAVPSAEKAT